MPDRNTNKIAFDSAQTSPEISIVMPTYNTPPEYLKESVESILKQTFADFELLVIDDGSTETQGIEWLETLQDPRIRLIRNHHDFIDSLNRGVAESKGKYIARMDADDITMPNRLQIQYDFMEEHPEIDICGLWLEMFGNQNYTAKLHTSHQEIVANLLLYNTMAHATVILRKSTVCKKNINLYKQGYDHAEDYKLWTDLSIKRFRFANIPEDLYKYRQWDKQITNVRRQEMRQSSLKVRMEYAEQMMQQIVEKEERFFNFFEYLIELANQSLISFKQLCDMYIKYTSIRCRCMKKNPEKNKLTVIIPFLNEGDEVENTLRSIRDTAGDSVDILIINDCSTDGFDYHAVALQYDAIYHKNEERQGVAASRDWGVESSQTPYFLLLAPI